MSARIEAATNAIIGENVIDADDDLFTVWMHEVDKHAGTVTEVATRALAAADAVMFSDEAIERAENAVYSLAAINAPEIVRVVVSALKGEQP